VRDLTYLVRTDQEAASERGEVRSPDGTTSLVTDWLLEQQPSLANRIAGAARRRLDFRSVEARYRAQANAECQRGVELLGRGRAIVTDRLHGHILSLLLDRPHVVVDNSYGKIGGVLDAWTGADPLVHRADDFHEARKIAARLVQA
jgi:pyruvyl transferase EpsO